MDILSFLRVLRNNSSQLKDLMGVLFTAIATIVAILSYRRARFTLFQPLKSEVVKRQADILLDLYSDFSKDKLGIISALDYYDLVMANIYTILRDLELIEAMVRNDETSNNVLSQSHMVFDLKQYGLHSTVVGDIHENVSFDIPRSKEEIKSKKIERLMNIINHGFLVKEITLTNANLEFTSKVARLAKNPLMPRNLSLLLDRLLDEINTNLKVHLKAVIEENVVSVAKSLITEKEKRGVNFDAVINEFLRRSIKHDLTVEKICQAIRDTLKVDLQI